MLDQDHLREMIEVISGELELRPLLTIIVQKACELLHADRGSIGLVDESEHAVRIEAVYKMPPEEFGSTARPGEGLAGKVYEDRKPVLIERYGGLSSPLLLHMDEDSVVGMPIMWRGDIIGTFGIGAAPPRRFSDHDLKMLETFARHAAIAINNAQSHQRERSYAALKERQRLAHDLHDNVSQLIFSLTLVAQSVGAGFDKSKPEGEARIARMLEIAGLAQTEMKALLAELKAPHDDAGSMAAFARRNGLAAALTRHSALAAPEGVSVDIDIDENAALAFEQTETLLRIAQEAMANACRHGGARNIDISLTHAESANGPALRFRVDNDGRGLTQNVEEKPGSTRIGLSSMRDRAARIGGALTVSDRSVGGVRVEVILPLS